MFLLDTNVWLDNYKSNRQNSRVAQHMISEAKKQDAYLFYPVHSIKDVFYMLGKLFKQEAALENGELSEQDARAINALVWACIDNMRSLATAVGAGQADVNMACKYRKISNDLEDNLVIAAAERAQVDFIVTRDEKLLRKSTVPAFTPEDALAYLEM